VLIGEETPGLIVALFRAWEPGLGPEFHIAYGGYVYKATKHRIEKWKEASHGWSDD